MFTSGHKASRFVLPLACLVVLFFGTASAFGQQIFGSIFGTVTDATGGAIPNAKVTISDQDKGTRSEVTTNDSGNFQKNQLIPGTYMIEVEAAHFRKAVAKDVRVSVDQSAKVDFGLQVGEVTQQVEVTAVAPLLQSDRADVATTYSSQQLTNLPSFDRNFQAFELLAPGAQRLGWNHASSENPQGSEQIQVNGQPFSATGYELDGTTNQDPILGIIVINPNIDAVTEAKISGTNYDAEFAYTGAGVVNASTKSGTNELHGSAFEFFRNNSPGFQDFARNPFTQNSGSVPPTKWNQFGGSLGGHLIKNKLFFFGDTQLTRRRDGSTVKTSVPTALARTGNLSEYLNGGNNQLFDPTTGDPVTGLGRHPFANNVITPGLLSPQALNVLKLIPGPNAPGDPGAAYRNNYIASGSRLFDVNNWDTRWDYFINDKSSLFGRYSYQAFNQQADGAFGSLAGGQALDNVNFAGVSDVRNQSIALGYNRTFSPTLITEFRFGFMRYRVVVTPNGLGTSPAKDAGIPNLNNDNFFTSGLPYFDLTGDAEEKFGYSLGANQCNCPLNEREQQFQWVNNTTKIMGNHTIKLGADLRYALNLRVPSDSHRSGELYFDSGITANVLSANGNTAGGLGLATFLLGDVSRFNRYVSSSTDAQERQKRFFWYGQDTWRITPKLTFNYGVRWEMIFPETVNAPGNGATLSLVDGLLHVFGVGQTSSHGIQNMNWKNFAPRAGIAYQLTPKTVIRAGYGWSYSLGTFGTSFGHNVTQNIPVLANQQLNTPSAFLGVFTLAQGPPSPVIPAVNTTTGTLPLPKGIDGKVRPEDMRLPRAEAYNLTVEHQLTSRFVVSAGYVGNVGRHAFNLPSGQLINVNQANFVPGVSNSNLLKPFFGKFGWDQNIDFYCDCANTRYDSLQIQATMRNYDGLTLQWNYTYQRMVGNNGDSYTFLYNRPLGYGNSDSLSHQLITVPENWEIPFGRGKKHGGSMSKGMDLALGGWQINGVTSYTSGRPFNPNIGNFPAGAARPNQGPGGRPDAGSADAFSVGGATGDRNHFFGGIYKVPGDPSSGLSGAFAFPADNTFGNIGYNNYFGPRFFQQDLSLSKSFALKERLHMELRAEAFNVFNHTNLADPNSDVTSPQVGQITGIFAPVATMRTFQFALRFNF
ncbi:MAG: TonB-dependent receptor [Acidobacteriia bacterium]|nr:TonB-dependent receptor [Terriglobia bacterium]